MTIYSFLASSRPLPEIDLSGFLELTVKEIKQMKPVPSPPDIVASWEDLDEEEVILYAESEDEIGGLGITYCATPPAQVGLLISLPYIYWVEGDFQPTMHQQLIDYLSQQIHINDEIEYWTICTREQLDEPVVNEITIQHFSYTTLQNIRSQYCSCLVLSAN